VAPNEPVASHPDFEAWKANGLWYKERFLRQWRDFVSGQLDPEDPDDHQIDFGAATCRVQVVRSISDWSHGYLTEHSIQNACECLLFVGACGNRSAVHITQTSN